MRVCGWIKLFCHSQVFATEGSEIKVFKSGVQSQGKLKFVRENARNDVSVVAPACELGQSEALRNLK